jgi:endonuclease/exonuclease/phosphatase family metal-dependent hydrolase
VLTQNAWGGAPLWARRRAALAATIAEIRPDVVGLQEIHADDARSASQADELAELAGYDATFAPARVTAAGHCEGVAILVKRSALVVSHDVLSLSRDDSDPLDGPHPRVVLRATVRFPEEGDAVLDAMVTHLSLSRRARARTIAELIAFASAGRPEGANAIIIGDLNATPDEPTLEALASHGWLDAWAHRHDRERGGTWPAGLAFKRLDYVFARPASGWSIGDVTRAPVSGSDHQGLVARLSEVVD